MQNIVQSHLQKKNTRETQINSTVTIIHPFTFDLNTGIKIPVRKKVKYTKYNKV